VPLKSLYAVRGMRSCHQRGWLRTEIWIIGSKCCEISIIAWLKPAFALPIAELSGIATGPEYSPLPMRFAGL
jgi:hypothetical protein